MEKIGSFVSKKLVAVVAFILAATYLGEIELAKQVVMTYIGAQGAVDIMAAFKKKV